MSLGVANPLLIQLLPGVEAAALAVDGVDVSLQTTDIPGLMRANGDADALGRLSAALSGREGISYVEPERTVHIERSPNDPYFAYRYMWGLNGQYGINAPAAWDVTTGSTLVTVANIDSGIDYNHPDLYKNIWINQAEIPASRRANLADLDGDGRITFYDLNNRVNQGAGKITDINANGRIDGGDLIASMRKNFGGGDTGFGGWSDGVSQDGDSTYLDDLVGWNFVTQTNDPFDDQGHGTHVAGTIAAMGDNAAGVVGVNWTVSVMALKFIDYTGSGRISDAAAAVRYAADHGARVSNNSYGGGGGTTLSDAITYAASKGSIFVAAAGNSGQDTDISASYPSSYPQDNIISVAAIASDGSLAGFSNYGASTVDVGAPGVSILSTTPYSGLGYLSGTSMAAPHVTGTVALVLAQHPDWTYSQIIQRILKTTTSIAALAGKTVTGGIINAAAALAPPAASASASYLGTDATTGGDWMGAYGGDGYVLAGDASALPSYAAVTPSGHSSWTWAASTADPRALLKPAGGDRLASTWYAADSFSVDVALTDGQPHRLSLYAVDWDGGGGRSQRVELLDAATGAVLDVRTLDDFQGGVYLSWTVTGSVRVRLTNLGNSNAVLSGLFLGGAAKPPSASYLGTDATTGGDWMGAYGGDGYVLAGDASALPSYAAVTPSGHSSWTWAASTADPRALLKPAGGDRLASTWYAADSFSVDVALTDGQPHRLSLYAVDWDGDGGRSQRVELLDAATGAVLDGRTLDDFQGGVYLSWTVTGSVRVRLTNIGNSNAVLSGLFLGG